MNTAVVNIKTDPGIKNEAQKIASELGFSLSSLLNGYMRHLIKTKTVYFTAKGEEPSEYLIEALKESEDDRETGRVSPPFANAKDAAAWLDDPNKKYMDES